MQIIYEWSVEVEDEHGDIVESDFATTLKELLSYKIEGNICLIRRVGDEINGESDRTYAYVSDGRLPEFFEDGKIVPKRFHKEYKRYAK